MIYLASPYSHPEEQVRNDRYYIVMKVAVEQYFQKGLIVYSPIIHWHVAAFMHDLPGDHETWMKQDKGMIRISEALHVLRIDGWDTSKGVKSEIEFANLLEIPVVYV